MGNCFNSYCEQNCNNLPSCKLDKIIQKFPKAIAVAIESAKKKMGINKDGQDRVYSDPDIFLPGLKQYLQVKYKKYEAVSLEQANHEEIDVLIGIIKGQCALYNNWCQILEAVKRIDITIEEIDQYIKQVKSIIVFELDKRIVQKQVLIILEKTKGVVIGRDNFNLKIEDLSTYKGLYHRTRDYMISCLGVKQVFINSGRIVRDRFSPYIMSLITKEIDCYEHHSPIIVNPDHYRAAFFFTHICPLFFKEEGKTKEEQALYFLPVWNKIRGKTYTHKAGLTNFNHYERQFRKDLKNYLYPYTNDIQWLIAIIKSPVAGDIKDVSIQPGKPIKTKDTAVVINKKKIKSPRNGIITEVNCQSNETVVCDQILFKVNALEDKFKNLSYVELHSLLITISDPWLLELCEGLRKDKGGKK